MYKGKNNQIFEEERSYSIVMQAAKIHFIMPNETAQCECSPYLSVNQTGKNIPLWHGESLNTQENISQSTHRVDTHDTYITCPSKHRRWSEYIFCLGKRTSKSVPYICLRGREILSPGKQITIKPPYIRKANDYIHPQDRRNSETRQIHDRVIAWSEIYHYQKSINLLIKRWFFSDYS